MNISQDKLKLLEGVVTGNACIVTGEAGTGKTFVGGLCGAKLLHGKRRWQKVLYLTYSKLAKWQIIETVAKLVTDGLIDKEIAKRMEIQNYHSLWWDIVCKHRAFLGIDALPKLCLYSELEQIVRNALDDLPEEDRLRIVPGGFLRRTDQGLNEKKRGVLERALTGSSLLYSQWGCDHYGKDALEFVNGGDYFISWASEQIKNRNKHGMFSHAETVWWANKLLQIHPNAANLMRTVYPVMIIDEFQDIDISQWQTIKLIAPETLIVMGDTKQTIHRWRGADPDKRFDDLRSFCKANEKYQLLMEFPLTERNRSSIDMADPSNITSANVTYRATESYTKEAMLLSCKYKARSCVKAGTVGVLCISNSLADDVCSRFRVTQKGNSETGKDWSCPKLNCVRLGAENSPFEVVRILLLTLVNYLSCEDKLIWYIANDVAWNITGLAESRLPKCGPKSRKEEPVLRRSTAKKIANLIKTNFALGLLDIKTLISCIEKHENCYSDRQMLGCINHVGKQLIRFGHHAWNKLSLDEKTRKIDGLILQYENACAGRMNEKIFVMTVHQAKGREFDTVIIPWFTPTKWAQPDAHSWSPGDADFTELFHTACTRSKKIVIVMRLVSDTG